MKQSTDSLATLDKAFVWHPFTQMGQWEEDDPLIIESGDGAMLRDSAGREYIDGVSSLWCNVHGHRRSEINDAIKAQLEKIAHSTLLGLGSVPSIELADRLVEIAPQGLDKVFYSDDGSTAVEIALKIAFQYWQQRDDPRPDKKTFVSLEYAYHGDTLGAVSVGGIDLFHEVYGPLLFEKFTAPAPYCYRCSLEKEPKTCRMACLKQLEEILIKHHDAIAAVIMEPLVQGAGGMIVHPEGYLEGVRELCTGYDVLLIADEVATGFGRTGKMFACEHENVMPDLMCVAKGITGGYLPLAATLATNVVYEAFLGQYAEMKTFFHGHTFSGNALACAAALASLDIFENENVLEKLQPKIELLTRSLAGLAPLTHVGDIRQRGFMVGIELVKDKGTREAYAWEEQIGAQVIQEARKRGVILRPLGNVIVLMPPLCISEQTLHEMMDVVEESIKKVTE